MNRERYAAELQQDYAGFMERPDAIWKYLASLAALPVETRSRSLLEFHTVHALAIGLVTLFIYILVANPALGQSLVFVPTQIWTNPLTVITCFFMHGSLWHVIGNSYFLAIFGDDVEYDLGVKGALSLIFTSHIVGTLAHAFFFYSDTGLVGASAGVYGVLGYYAVRFPFRRISYLFLFFFFFNFPAWVSLFFKFGMEIILAMNSLGGSATNVAHLAHLGGLFVGMIWGVLNKR